MPIEQRLAPLWDVAVPLAIMAATLAIAARFGALIPGLRNGVRSTALRRVFGIVGFLAIVSGSAGTMLATASMTGTAREPTAWLPPVLWLLVALSGAVFASVFLASRLKLTLEVRDAGGRRSVYATARELAVLSELAGRPASGLHTPDGSDLEVLASAIPKVSSSGWWDVVQSLFKYLFLGSPWRIVVDTDFEREAIVGIARNGKSIELVRIHVPNDLSPQMSVMWIDAYVAAIIAVTLAARHSGFEGLAGATSWSSVAAFFLATKEKDGSADFYRWARQAVRLDRRNFSAILALRVAENTDNPEDNDFASWLRDELQPITKLPRGRRSLDVELRARRQLAIAETNLKANGLSVSLPEMAENILTLVKRLSNVEKPPTELQHVFRSDAASLVRELRQASLSGSIKSRVAKAEKRTESWFFEAESSRQPDVAYNLACHYAVSGETDKAIGRLKVAVEDPQLKSLARSDPELSSLQRNDVFRQLVDDAPLTDYWALPQFAGLKERMRECGVYQPDDLLHMQNPYAIASHLGLGRVTFRPVLGRAQFVRGSRLATEKVSVNGLEVNLLGLVFAAGISIVEDIPYEWLEAKAGTAFADGVDGITVSTNRVLRPADALQWLKELSKRTESLLYAGESPKLPRPRGSSRLRRHR
jgi:hypothetical protein